MNPLDHAALAEEAVIDLETIDQILEIACRAPSIHNTQPWSWRVSKSRVDLYADFARQLVYADPQRRDLLISCGAALHHFEEAARAMGWASRVRRTPDPAEPRFIASIQLRPGVAPPDSRETLEAISRRRTDRRQLTSWPVPAERLSALAMTGNRWGAQVLPILDESMKAQLERLTAHADELQRRNPGYVREINSSTTYWADTGVPVGHIPRSSRRARATVGGRLRFPNGVLDDTGSDDGPPADGMLLITTSSDDTVSRVRAGEALSAVWLQATRDNMSAVPLSQALEVAETRRVVQNDVLDDLACAQVVLRVGWVPAGRRQLTPTPRRDVDDVRVRV
jgi:hypothetical protein